MRNRLIAAAAALGLAAAGLVGPIASAHADAGSDPLAYVAEDGGMTPGGIVVVDAVTDTVVGSIPGIYSAENLALNPSGTVLYATDGGTTLSAIDTSTDAVVTSVSIGQSITGLALNPAGTAAYVSGFETGTVSVINTATMTVTATIPDAGNSSIAVSPTGTEAYSFGFNSHSVNVIDTATNTVTATIPVDDPSSAAFSPDGTHAYVTSAIDGTVTVIDTGSNTVTATVAVGTEPSDIAVSPTGALAYAINNYDSTVSVIDTASLAVIATIPVAYGAISVAFNAAGTLAFVDSNIYETLSTIDTGTNTVTSTVTSLGYNPIDVAVTQDAWPTAITLAATPAGTATDGSPVTLTATVSPSTPGTVQFVDGGAALGASVPVTANTASYTTSALATGSHTFTAVFTPAAGTSTGSTSPPVMYQVSSPAIAIEQTITANGKSTVSTAPISTTGPRMLVAFTSSDGPATKQNTTVTSADLTWTLAARANSKGGTAEIWTALATGPLIGVTVTSTPKTAGYDQLLTVLVLTNARGVGATATAGKAKGVPMASLTTAAAGSWVFGVGEDYTSATAPTLGAGQNLISRWVDTGPGEAFWVQNQQAATPSASTVVTINDTAPIADTWNLAAAEILATNP